MLHPLLAGAFTVLSLASATASSVATTIVLRDWAHTSYEASLAAAGDLPVTTVRRFGAAPASR